MSVTAHTPRSWREILEFPLDDGRRLNAEAVDARYLRLSTLRAHDAMAELNLARDEALREITS